MKKIYTSLFYAFLFLNNFSLNSYFKHSLSLSKTHDRIRGSILNRIKNMISIQRTVCIGNNARLCKFHTVVFQNWFTGYLIRRGIAGYIHCYGLLLCNGIIIRILQN